MLLPVNAPGFHVKVNAPVAVNVAVAPAHIAVGFVVAFIVGVGLTFKFTVEEPIQPKEEVATTV